MPKLTAINDVIVALVAALNGTLSYPVFDGPLTKRPARDVTSYVCIGAEEPYNDENTTPINSASMNQVWVGLGQAARDETLKIPCVAVGIAFRGSVAQARASALSAVQDVFSNLNPKPTDATYNALVEDIVSLDSRNLSGGAEVVAKFTISAEARLR